MTGKEPRIERKTFKAVASLRIATLETMLLDHVDPGTRINYRQTLESW